MFFLMIVIIINLFYYSINSKYFLIITDKKLVLFNYIITLFYLTLIHLPSINQVKFTNSELIFIVL
jgi:hypothetical protein